MKTTLCSLFIVSTITLFGQVDSITLILTEAQSDIWFDQLKQLKLEEQIQKINSRILLDTNVYILNGIDRVVPPGKFPGDCRLLIIPNGTPIFIANHTKAIHLEQLTKLLKNATVKRIEIPQKEQIAALYPPKGMCNAIIITTKKSTKRKINDLDKKMRKRIILGVRWRH